MRLAHSHQHNKKSVWSDNKRALERMRGDISVMREYFESLASSYPALNRAVETEFEILDTVHELMSIAAGYSRSTDSDFIILLQKRVKNITITKFAVGDLWHLVKPTDEKAIYDMVDKMEDQLKAVAPNDEGALATILARQTVPGLRLDQELAKLCEEGRTKRSRPGLKKSTAEQGEIMLNSWKKTWEKLIVENEV
jgi:hypothetical protein